MIAGSIQHRKRHDLHTISPLCHNSAYLETWARAYAIMLLRDEARILGERPRCNALFKFPLHLIHILDWKIGEIRLLFGPGFEAVHSPQHFDGMHYAAFFRKRQIPNTDNSSIRASTKLKIWPKSYFSLADNNNIHSIRSDPYVTDSLSNSVCTTRSK